MRFLMFLVVFAAAVAGGAWLWAGQADGPVLDISAPTHIGQIGEVSVAIETPDAQLKRVEIHLEQNGQTYELFEARPRHGFVPVSETAPTSIEPGSATALTLETPESPDRLRFTASIGKRSIPKLESGPARVVVTAVRPVLFEMREARSTASAELEVELTPPSLGALSRLHFINHGGSEMVVYRVTPPEADSGVRVGDQEYPGFPATGAGIPSRDPGLRVAFFGLLASQSIDTPIRLYARDALENEATAAFDYRVFPKQFRQSRIVISDGFLSRVVPAILEKEPQLDEPKTATQLEAYLRINRDLRKTNNASITSLAKQTAPEILWEGRFKQLMNSAVEAGFADQRTYLYHGRPVDEQVHLGFDLASTAMAPVHAANRGRVLHADWLGIYGNCVIVDHGMGLQSLYAHLSTIAVAPGDLVERDAVLGRSGSTGLAGGDHLHFTMMLAGNPVTAIDWWSEQWLEDRIERKRIEAGMPAD